MPGFFIGRCGADQRLSPARKIVARTKEARTERTKAEFIGARDFSPGPERNRISPKPSPRPETLVRKRAADSAVEASPTSSGLYSLAARIQKINPDKLIVIKLSMR